MTQVTSQALHKVGEKKGWKGESWETTAERLQGWCRRGVAWHFVPDMGISDLERLNCQQEYIGRMIVGGLCNGFSLTVCCHVVCTFVGPRICGGVAYGIRPLVAALPSWFRFAQCMRRYRDTRLAFPHLVNAGKYATTFFVVIFSTLHSIYKGMFVSFCDPWKILKLPT